MNIISRARNRALLAVAALALALLVPVAASAVHPCETPKGTAPPRGVVNPAATANPLDNGAWAVAGKKGRSDEWAAWCGSAGEERAQLGKISSWPRMTWFGHWMSTDTVDDKVRDYIANAQHYGAYPNTVVHMALFRLWPREEANMDIPLTAAEQAAYKDWMNAVIAGIPTNTRVALVMEPDLGIAGWNSRVKDKNVRLGLVRWATYQFRTRRPNVAVYLDGSSADWLSVDKAASMLVQAGVQHARGFALGATHYSTLGSEIVYAKNVAERLRVLGVPGKKAVIDTSDNGKGFTYAQFYAEHGPRSSTVWFDNAFVCASKADTTCVTLGVPPTWQVARPGMSATMQSLARTYVDGYTWFGRSWLYAQATPYQKYQRALPMARTTIYQ